MAETYNSIPEYIAAQTEAQQEYLNELYVHLQETLPGTTEDLSWGMPTFRRKKIILHFAASKKYMGIYPGAKAVSAFAKELEGFETSKGTIKIPYEHPLPLDLVSKIAKWCDENK